MGGWLRLVGSWKTQVSFAKEPYKRNYTTRLLFCVRTNIVCCMTVSSDRIVFLCMFSAHLWVRPAYHGGRLSLPVQSSRSWVQSSQCFCHTATDALYSLSYRALLQKRPNDGCLVQRNFRALGCNQVKCFYHSKRLSLIVTRRVGKTVTSWDSEKHRSLLQKSPIKETIQRVYCFVSERI